MVDDDDIRKVTAAEALLEWGNSTQRTKTSQDLDIASAESSPPLVEKVQTQQQQNSHQTAEGPQQRPSTYSQHQTEEEQRHERRDLSDENSMLSMTSIGFGIDSSPSAGLGDATNAALKAVQDAMDRSSLRLPILNSPQSLLQVKVQLGVPARQGSPNETMAVDVSQLSTVLPSVIPILPISVQVGGLHLTSESQRSPPICTAVACITLQSTLPFLRTSQTSSNDSARQCSPSQHRFAHTVASAATSQPFPDSSDAVADPTTLQTGVEMPSRNSMQMLAMISQEIRSNDAENLRLNGSAVSMNTGRSAAPMQGIGQHNANTLEAARQLQSESEYPLLVPHIHGSGDDAGNDAIANHNYKKLPPGVTTKNNQRLFVKHQYKDLSMETPSRWESDGNCAMNPKGTIKLNAPAFPVKLHETLSLIENDGHADIISWLPHGRSFKIHKQKEFSEIILPRYFVMTKKSSFLRQLNLYCFNRFSAGPDQGSYYHDHFLRGLKFLTRRMQRQKINGNRIRSAGNPEAEPNLVLYPVCPPSAVNLPNNPNRMASAERSKISCGALE